jgi:Protein of unknown function (DUF2917)
MMNAKGNTMITNLTNLTTHVSGFDLSPHNPRMGLDLQHKALFTLADALGVRIRCTSGSIWLTLDNDARDILLNPGDVFEPTAHSRVVLYSLQASHVSLEHVAQAADALAKPIARQHARGAFQSLAMAGAARWMGVKGVARVGAAA